jgi:flagellar biosynthesis/type III secretory pathway protein FliH
MRVSWFWPVVEMALSDLKHPVAPWSPSPLLNGKSQASSFLRTQWDEAKAHAFGPWRVIEHNEPTDALTLPAPLNASESTEETNTPLPQATDPANTAAQEPEKNQVSEAALAAMLDEAFQRGIQQGQAHLLAQLEAERNKERELIRHLGIELRSISQDPQRFFEPLKRLSLHLAEQLVRAELQISGRAVQGLIQSCIQQLDHPAQPVKVSLNPEDMKRLQAMGEAVTEHLDLEADPQLRPGSVRVRVQDSLVQDLIEHRLEPLARRLLPQPEAWMKNSSLVQDRVDAMPESAPKRDWDRQVIDVQDTDVKTTPSDEPDENLPS